MSVYVLSIFSANTCMVAYASLEGMGKKYQFSCQSCFVLSCLKHKHSCFSLLTCLVELLLHFSQIELSWLTGHTVHGTSSLLSSSSSIEFNSIILSPSWCTVAEWYGAGLVTARSRVRIPPAAAVHQCQLSVPSLWGQLMSTSESLEVNGHTTWCTSSVSMVLRHRLLIRLRAKETEISAAPWAVEARERTLLTSFTV